MSKTRCEYNYRGIGAQGFYDSSTFETYSLALPQLVNDDFVGADVVIPASGSDESGVVWSKKIVGSGPPTVAKTADGVNGFILCAGTADSEKQDAALHMNDELMCSIAQGAVFEARLALTVLPTGNGVCSWGLWGAWGDGGSTYRVGFEVVAASGAVYCESDDNATDTAALSGVTMVAGTYHTFMIDTTVQADIKFYIDGARVAGSTTFANAASAANSKCQPHVGQYKASGTGLGSISVDYVKVWQARS